MAKLERLLEAFMEQEKITRFEGETGVQNLCRIVHAIGYKDPLHYGQFASNGAYGDLHDFLADNPGCCEMIFNWIVGNPPTDRTGDDPQEWCDSVESLLKEPLKEEDDDE